MRSTSKHFAFLREYLHYSYQSPVYPESFSRLVMREFGLSLADAKEVVDDMFRRLGLDTENGACVRYCYAIAYDYRLHFHVQDSLCMTKQSDVAERDWIAANHRFVDFVDAILVLDISSDLLKGDSE
jgi:hypothetical protein